MTSRSLSSTVVTLAAGIAAAGALGVAVPLAAAAGPPTPPTLTDATAERLVAANDVEAGDTVERDYAIGDLDNDGDPDLVVGRRRGLNDNNCEARPNVLLMNEGGVLTDRTAELAPALGASERTRDVIVVDLEADGWLDVVVADGVFFETIKGLRNRGEDAGTWLGLEDTTAAAAGLNTDAWTLAAGDLGGAPCPADFDGTEVVDFADLLVVLANFG